MKKMSTLHRLNVGPPFKLGKGAANLMKESVSHVSDSLRARAVEGVGGYLLHAAVVVQVARQRTRNGNAYSNPQKCQSVPKCVYALTASSSRRPSASWRNRARP